MVLWPLVGYLLATAAARQLRSSGTTNINNEVDTSSDEIQKSRPQDDKTLFVDGWSDDGSFDPEADHDPMGSTQRMQQARDMYGPYGHRFGSLLDRGLPFSGQSPRPVAAPPAYSLGQSVGGAAGAWQQRDEAAKKQTINVYAMTMPPNIQEAVARQLGFKNAQVTPVLPATGNMPFAKGFKRGNMYATGFAQQPQMVQNFNQYAPAISPNDQQYFNQYLPPGYTTAADPGMALASLYGVTNAPATPFPVQAVANEEREMDSIDSMADPTLAPSPELARAELAPDPAPLPRAEDVLARAAAKAPIHHAVQKAASQNKDAMVLDLGNNGKIVIMLRDDAAPRTCAMLRQMVQRGMYDGCVFYRAEPGFVIQGGLRDAEGNARTNPFGTFPFEYKLPNKRGTVTMARYTDPNSATGEFFINLNDNRNLDASGGPGYGQGFEVWGQVVSGMDVAQRIVMQPSNMDRQTGMHMLQKPVIMQKVTIVKV